MPAANVSRFYTPNETGTHPGDLDQSPMGTHPGELFLVMYFYKNGNNNKTLFNYEQ